MRKIAMALLALFVVSGALSACNTVEGLGRDTSAAGRGLSNSAENVKEKL